MNTLNKHLETVRINLADRSYDILIGENLLGKQEPTVNCPKLLPP